METIEIVLAEGAAPEGAGVILDHTGAEARSLLTKHLFRKRYAVSYRHCNPPVASLILIAPTDNVLYPCDHPPFVSLH